MVLAYYKVLMPALALDILQVDARGYGLLFGPPFVVALTAAVALGLFDAMGVTVRHSVAQLETPDEMRGRTLALYSMASRGGTAEVSTVRS
jgi:hypothetical protein